MRFIAINLLLIAFSVSCKEQKPDLNADQDRSRTLYFPEVQFYILEAPQSGAISNPNMDSWKGGVSWLSLSTADVDEQTKEAINKYEMRYQYMGSESTKPIDHYLVTMSPPDSDPITMELEYKGVKQEVWGDDRYKAGIRPTQKQEGTQVGDGDAEEAF